MPVFLNASAPEFEAAFTALLSAKREEAVDVDDTVAAIIADVRARGDAAVIELTAKFDKLELTPDRLAFFTRRNRRPKSGQRCPPTNAPHWNWPRAHSCLSRAPTPRRCPLDGRHRRRTGLALGAVAAAGLYCAGRSGQLNPSSVLMNAIPAQVAGVERLSSARPRRAGWVNPLVLLAAQIAGWTLFTALAGRRPWRPWPMAPTPSRQWTRSRAGQCLCCRRQAAGCSGAWA